jgi:Major capsid protein Gp23.
MDLTISEALQKKWKAIVEHADLPEIKDSWRKTVTTQLLENQEQYLKEAAPVNLSNNLPGDSSGNVAKWDPILISLVRRAMPNLIAYDICGVQPMSGPTGLIFALRSRYNNQTGAEALFQEADTRFGGSGGTPAYSGAGYTGGLTSGTGRRSVLRCC